MQDTFITLAAQSVEANKAFDATSRLLRKPNVSSAARSVGNFVGYKVPAAAKQRWAEGMRSNADIPLGDVHTRYLSAEELAARLAPRKVLVPGPFAG